MSKKQDREMEYIRMERVVIDQGKQLSSCWSFLQNLKANADPHTKGKIDEFLTGQPFYSGRKM
jgi:hypothetical protein